MLLVGLRNPWRFSFDRGTGLLWIGDAGQNAAEEIDRIDPVADAGANLGWNLMEASQCFSQPDCSTDGLTLPVVEYGRDLGCAVTGGYVYRGDAIDDLRGWYLFSDYCTGRLFGVPSDAEGVIGPRTLLETGVSVSTFGEGPDGELYLADLGRRRDLPDRRRRLTERSERAQARPSAAADDQVVEQLDVEEPARLGQLGRDPQVLAGRRRIAARMVVGHDDRGSARANGVPIDLTDADGRSGEVAAVDGALRRDHVLRVEQQHPQLLTLERAHRVDERLGDVCRCADQPRVGRPASGEPRSDLDRGRQARGGSRRDPGEAQLRGVSAGNLGQAAEPIDEPPAEPTSAIAAAQEDRDQLLVVAGVGPETLEATRCPGGSRLALDGKADRLRRHRRRG